MAIIDISCNLWRLTSVSVSPCTLPCFRICILYSFDIIAAFTRFSSFNCFKTKCVFSLLFQLQYSFTICDQVWKCYWYPIIMMFEHIEIVSERLRVSMHYRREMYTKGTELFIIKKFWNCNLQNVHEPFSSHSFRFYQEIVFSQWLAFVANMIHTNMSQWSELTPFLTLVYSGIFISQ